MCIIYSNLIGRHHRTRAFTIVSTHPSVQNHLLFLFSAVAAVNVIIAGLSANERPCCAVQDVSIVRMYDI